MIKKFLCIGSFAFLQLIAKSQTVDDTAIVVDKSKIDYVYNHYIQDGNNSAITGGIGTEQLIVYGPSITINKIKSKSSTKINFGTDIISSASTDRIDFVMSSASSIDARTYVNFEYNKTINNKGLNVYGGVGLSAESDYFSLGYKIGFVKEDKINLSSFATELQIFNDDLRWGFFNNGTFQKLIYPFELRYKDWYTEHKRNSYNLKISYSKAINKKTVIGISTLLTYQNGLLATPFHRIYFKDGSQGVEQLPYQRLKASFGLKLNQFVGNKFIFKTSLNPYIDNWGIAAIGVENETAIKLNSSFTFLPNAKFFIQQGSKYFAAFKQHNSNNDFYTSDYDLSSFHSYNFGFGLRHSPYKRISEKVYLNSFTLRYNYYNRSNGLFGHLISLTLQTEW